MSENSDNYLPLPSWEDIPPLKENVPEFLKDDDWFGTDISADFLDFSEPYRSSRCTMRR